MIYYSWLGRLLLVECIRAVSLRRPPPPDLSWIARIRRPRRVVTPWGKFCDRRKARRASRLCNVPPTFLHVFLWGWLGVMRSHPDHTRSFAAAPPDARFELERAHPPPETCRHTVGKILRPTQGAACVPTLQRTGTLVPAATYRRRPASGVYPVTRHDVLSLLARLSPTRDPERVLNPDVTLRVFEQALLNSSVCSLWRCRRRSSRSSRSSRSQVPQYRCQLQRHGGRIVRSRMVLRGWLPHGWRTNYRFAKMKGSQVLRMLPPRSIPTGHASQPLLTPHQNRS